MSTADLIQAQRAFFDHGRTKNLAFRAVALERLERQIRAREHGYCALCGRIWENPIWKPT